MRGVLVQGWGTAGRRPRRAADAERTSRPLATTSVLVVDDDERVRRLTARMLREFGYTTTEADSGAEALAILAHRPDIQVVVTDLVMPGIHGIELAERVRTGHPHCRVVLVTGYAPDQLGRFGARRPGLPLLLKPFVAEELVRQIRHVLGDAH